MGAGVTVPLAFLDAFAGAIEFIFSPREAVGGGIEVGGLGQVGELTGEHLKVSGAALVAGLAVALPAGLYLGHRGRAELLAVGIGNAGRAIPELALIAFLVAFVGVGLVNVTIALMVLAIPPVLTNTFVGVRQVDANAIDAARGVGMGELAIALRVELPLAAPTIMAGVRTAAINVIATATIAPLAGVVTLGDFILSRNVYGDQGVLAGAILVALLAIVVELTLAAVQTWVTPKGVRLERGMARA
jgi:osmoprotectant transport system permease protein